MANFNVSFPAIVLSMTILLLTAMALYFISARMQAPNKVKALSWALLGGTACSGSFLSIRDWLKAGTLQTTTWQEEILPHS